MPVESMEGLHSKILRHTIIRRVSCSEKFPDNELALLAASVKRRIPNDDEEL